MTDNLTTLLRKAHDESCTSTNLDCYSGTCPVNTIAFLLNEHKDRHWLLYGLMVYLDWLGQTK